MANVVLNFNSRAVGCIGRVVTMYSSVKVNAFYVHGIRPNMCSEFGAGNTTNLAKRSILLSKPVCTALIGITTNS